MINGMVTGYYNTGELKLEHQYKNGRFDGKCKDYFKNGNLKSVKIYKEFIASNNPNILQETGKTIYEISEKERSTLYNNKGLMNDYVYEIYEDNFREDGAKESSKHFIGKYRVGEWKYYYPNEKLSKIEHYNNDKLHGEQIHFYDNKQIKLKSFYTNGFKNGEWIAYFENGKVMQKYNYTHDRLGGSYIEYYENGIIKEEGEYAGDKKYKKWKYFNDKGELLKTEIWKRGELIKTSNK